MTPACGYTTFLLFSASDLSRLSPQVVSALAGRSARGGGPAAGVQKKKESKPERREKTAAKAEAAPSSSSHQGGLQVHFRSLLPLAPGKPTPSRSHR
ncbi:hypothetical protein N0V84_010279 [Fusarium piperis]|uniref:Uncharacterized protein n=1 Tax=Fusarium piperis TaxID=1435070 RepID=A0A9W9BGR3_9HYPO|nr:hypothetical protein N0V84_010279 [Fusarium piperis]